LSVTADAVAAKKQRQPTLRLQWVLASSIAKSTPPIGAPKAAAKPAATPAEQNSRLSASLWRMGTKRLRRRFGDFEEERRSCSCSCSPPLSPLLHSATLSAAR
jgi:hypothetical protein